MSAQQFLNVGDVFAVKMDMNVRVTVPKMFAYTGMPKATDPASRTIKVGEILDNGAKKKLKTNSFIGDYVVVDTRFDGGGNAVNDNYPDGHHVFAQRLAKDGSYDPEGETVDFYQSGYFNCVVPFDKTPVIRTLTKVISFV